MNSPIRTVFRSLATGVLFSAPLYAGAAFNFETVPAPPDNYYPSYDADAVYRTGFDTGTPIGATCEYDAENGGLSDTDDYWCATQTIGCSNFCMILCGSNGGVGGQTNFFCPEEDVTARTGRTFTDTEPELVFDYSYAGEPTVMCSNRLGILANWSYYCVLSRHTGLDAPPVATLTANPTTILSGGASNLTWSCSANTTSASIDQSIGSLSATGGVWSGTRSTGALSATKTYTLTCTGSGGSASASATVTVGSRPDLIASAITPVTASANATTTFSATVSNIGSVSTGAAFSVKFKWATDASGGGGGDILPVVSTNLLAASSSATVSKAYHISSAFAGSSIWLQACADGTSEITESNELNNCGPWTQITIPAVPLPNLVAGAITPTKAFAGTARTWSGPIGTRAPQPQQRRLRTSCSALHPLAAQMLLT